MIRDPEALARLREWLNPGDIVHTVLRHVSRSGMQREISLLLTRCVDGKPEVLDLTRSAALVLGYRIGKRDGIVAGGCGMDMGFALVYELSSALFSDGFGEPCRHCSERPTTEAHADAMRQAWCPARGLVTEQDGTPKVDGAGKMIPRGPHEFRGRNGDASGWDRDGGYALRQDWI